jgi:hypothetical protein
MTQHHNREGILVNTHIPLKMSGREYFGPEQNEYDIKNIVSVQSEPLQILGKYTGVWNGQLDDAVGTAVKFLYNEKPGYEEYLYHVNDLSICPTIEKMPEALGFVKGHYKAQIQLQRPGNTLSRHTDMPSIFHHVPTELQHNAIRVLVMLAPWEYGQLMGFHNTIWKEWEAGTIIYCDFLNTWHFTVNCSYHSRPVLQISGLADEDLIELIKNKQTRIINL